MGGLGRRGFELAAAQEQPGHAAPVRRQRRRPDRQGQAVLLRQLGALRQQAGTRRQRFVSLPTDALRRGDFSGTGVTIYDPASDSQPGAAHAVPGQRHSRRTGSIPVRPELIAPHARAQRGAAPLREQLHRARQDLLQARQHRHQGQLAGELQAPGVREVQLLPIAHLRRTDPGGCRRRCRWRRPARRSARAHPCCGDRRRHTRSARRCCSTARSATRSRSWVPSSTSITTGGSTT